MEKQPCLVITQEQSSRLTEVPGSISTFRKRKKERRKDKILKRDHSFLSSLQCVSWGHCDPGPELQSQKTWYVWPVQPISGVTNKVVRHRSQVGVWPEPDAIMSV